MISLNETINSKRENVISVFNRLSDEEYFVDSSFQRKLIWTETQKIRLIETILMGYPMPEVYIWAQRPDPVNRKQKFSVVDGQQRFSSIQQFISGEWALKEKALDKENHDKDYVGHYWESLSNENKGKILEYHINIREIPSNVVIEEIRNMFLRLNQTDKSLSPQEMRNAKFHGEFMQSAEQIAKEFVERKYNIFGLNAIRRMKDVEFAGQLLGYLIRGVADDDKESVNSLYNKYNDIYENRLANFRKTTSIFSKIDIVFGNDELRQFFSKPVQFYTLFATLDICSKVEKDEFMSKVSKFVKTYKELDFETGNIPNYFIEFRQGSVSRTSGRTSRNRRIDTLVDFIRGK